MSAPGLTTADDALLVGLLDGATRRIVVVAPALTKVVAAALAQRWRALGASAVSVIVDVDPEVYRLGYGDPEALDALDTASAELGAMVNRQSGIRIGLMIADDQTLVYSPTPRLIEAAPKRAALDVLQRARPNAVLLGPPPSAIEAQLGHGPRGEKDRTIGLDKAERRQIAEVRKNLAENPPLKFDISQTLRVFNAYFEFVELKLTDVMVGQRTARLPPELARFTSDEELNKAMQTSVRIIGGDSALSGERVKKHCDRIRKRFLVVIPNYKPVLLRANKPAFDRRFARLRSHVEAFGKRLEGRLQDAINATRDRLVKQILPQVLKSPPTTWLRQLGPNPSEHELEAMLCMTLDRVLGSAERMARNMDARVIHLGITYEMLTDPKFIETARKHMPGLKQFHSEYDAAKGKPQ